MPPEKKISMSTIFAAEERDLQQAVEHLQPEIGRLLESRLKQYAWTGRVDSKTEMSIKREVLDAAVQGLRQTMTNYIESANL